MASKKSLKIGIVVGLKSEERSIPKNNNIFVARGYGQEAYSCLLYTSPSPRDATLSRMPSSA